MKWDQPPRGTVPPNVHWGWNEESAWWPGGRVAADDWKCQTADPVTAIRWWGSYLGWQSSQPPTTSPSHFHILIWTDVPAGVDEPFSHPGQVIHEIHCYNYTQEFVGWDFDPRTGEYEACFLFEQTLAPFEQFYQDPGVGLYWVSVQACWDGMPPPGPSWGWKTRPRDPFSPAPDDAVTIWANPTPGLGTVWQTGGGAPLWFPTPEDSWDLAFELLSSTVVTETKWEQPPQINPSSPFPWCYWGWDEWSAYSSYQIVADDWLCLDPRLVSDIHWWGSYQGWDGPLPPLDAPDLFHIGIWTDAGPTPGFSHPGTMIWQWIVPRAALNEQYAGCDFFLNLPYPESTFRYDLALPPEAWFYQEPGPEGTLYWLSISAIYPAGGTTAYPWGWTTREHYFADDSVRIYVPTDPVPGSLFVFGEPIENPDGVSWDLAFLLTTQYSGEPYVKWSQPPVPYQPDDGFVGWNELSWFGGPQIVADDWVCTTDQPVTDLHWWGSYIGWTHREPPPDTTPLVFEVTVWTDVPADPDDPGSFSHPGQVIWQTSVTDPPAQFAGWDWDPRDPTQPPEACFRYDVTLDPSQWFYQEAGNHIYWISIAAAYPGGGEPPYPWGWKTRPRDPQSPAPDDAVRVFDPTAPAMGALYVLGAPIFWPTLAESWDVAFVLTTAAPEEPQHDLGDAPDSSNSFGLGMTAYPSGGPPGVPANYPTVYQAGSPPWGPIHLQPQAQAWLGPAVTLENEADVGPDQDPSNNIVPPTNSPDTDGADDGVMVPLRLPHCTPTTFDFAVTIAGPGQGVPLYVNVWCDWNRDGDWDDIQMCPDGTVAPEWCVPNQLLPALGPGTHTLTTLPFAPWHPATTPELPPLWMRITLSEQMWNPSPGLGWGGSGPPLGYEYGETEDYYFVPLGGEEAKWSQPPHGGGAGFDAASDLFYLPGAPGSPSLTSGTRSPASWSGYDEARASAHRPPNQPSNPAPATLSFNVNAGSPQRQWIPNPPASEANWDNDNYVLGGTVSWHTAMSGTVQGQGKAKAGLASDGGVVVDARARVRDANPGGGLTIGDSASGYGLARMTPTVVVISGGTPTVDAMIHSEAYLAAPMQSPFDQSPAAVTGVDDGVVTLPVNQPFVMVWMDEAEAKYPQLTVVPGSVVHTTLIVDDQVAAEGSVMMTQDDQGNTELYAAGAYSDMAFAPWTAPGPQGQWFEQNGARSFYGALSISLRLPTGYQFEEFEAVNTVVADDFISDGRPIKALRWWGSYLDSRYEPGGAQDPYEVDGWLVSFHPTAPEDTGECPPEPLPIMWPTALGVYFAPADAVQVVALDQVDCHGHAVYQYRVDLSQCCLLCSELDPRTGTYPAQPGRFEEVQRFRYWLDVQAVVGVRWVEFERGACMAEPTGHLPPEDGSHFWGWHTSAGPTADNLCGPLDEACVGRIVDFSPVPPSCWLYGGWLKQPWLCLTIPPPVQMAFELLADAPAPPLPPWIVVQPGDVETCEGYTATFTVEACGTPPLSYQWYRNGMPIGGATGSTLVISPVSESDEGAYTVSVTNAHGAVISDPVTLTVWPTGTGDTDGSGVTDGDDIQAFVTAVIAGEGDARTMCASDMNHDGVVDGGDVPPMVVELLSP